ncbi:DDT domain-containing protein DDB_G0282237-like [Pistacia vera]|uniref:DDT domain-containing protein DDB_G0282237-like n=1 Tax=Pistacia vera TaxID=55513 RepID=UPI001263046B|nr:DDT domain-containing protein DDB_G0282237-like [Pistacia vera]
MPLLKRKPVALLEPPQDLEPHELVYQVRFTKEIFRNYLDYLNRINLYRNRVWMCKSTGKGNLTYEEALVSEKRSAEKVQELPKELVAPALRIIQFSMLSLKDLADTIAAKLQECLFVGAELYGRKDDDLHPCKILKVVKADANRTQYGVAWLDRNKKSAESDLLDRENIVWKKPPFSRNFLKSFIRESTYRSIPWVLHDKLAQKHDISNQPPVDLRSKFVFRDGLLVCKKRKKRGQVVKEESGKCKRNKVRSEKVEGLAVENTKREDDQPEEEPIRYPIDDLLVLPGVDDPVFTDRPLPSRDFNVPMDCVGDLLMVWNFCSSFGRLLHLWPFSLEDFENALCHKDSNLSLIVESHSSLLRLIIKDTGENVMPIKNKKRKITAITWTEYLCDFLEIINNPELSSNMTTIKRGHYGLLDVNSKLGILRELVNQVLETDLIREKLDEHIEQRRALGSTRREEALEAARKQREVKEQLKAQSTANGVANGHSSDSTKCALLLCSNDNHIGQNGEITEKKVAENISSKLENSLESKPLEVASKKMSKSQNINVKLPAENGKKLSGKEALKKLRDDKKEPTEIRSKEQRKEYFEREMEKRVISTNPLGKDRHYNRYWWFRRDGRIFIESSDSKQWGYYSSKEELDLLMGSLNCKGERERALQKQLEKFYTKISSEFEKRSKNMVDRIALEEAVLRRSTRVRAPPRENPANAFLRYVNKWKED